VNDSVAVSVEDQGLVKVLASKPTNNHDGVVCELAGAKSLSRNQNEWLLLRVKQLDLFPRTRPTGEAVTDFEFFDVAGVSLGRVRNSAKYVSELAVEVTTGVVVSAMVQHRQLDPLVLRQVIKLTLLRRLVVILP
jgi:hypothetical protein